jgi:serine/threonine-protein kinase
VHQLARANASLGLADTLLGGEDQPAAAGPGAVPLSAVRLGNYELLGEIARGGMGVVYRARQVGLGRVVAVKMIVASSHAGLEKRDRFRREAQAVARLQHPNIVQIFEVGEADGRPFFSLEFLDGGCLADRLAGVPLPARRAAALVETLARAMHSAHQQGIVHRDLKPANVLLARDGTPKITDFGLAKLLDRSDTPTKPSEVLGTPSYMAPEQAAGKTREVGPAADVYALGAILYEALTGRPPFQGAGLLETLEQVRTQEPVPVRRLQPKVPRDLETVCHRCLEKDPARRYATAQALAEDLRRFQAGEPVQVRPVGPLGRAVKWARRRPAVAGLLLAVALVAAAGLAGVLWALWRGPVPGGTRAQGPVGKARQLARRDDDQAARGPAASGKANARVHQNPETPAPCQHVCAPTCCWPACAFCSSTTWPFTPPECCTPTTPT